MKRASYSCCNFLCIVLATAYLKYRLCRLSCLPFVWHPPFFIVTHTHTHTHTRARTHAHTRTHANELSLFSSQYRSCERPSHQLDQEISIISDDIGSTDCRVDLHVMVTLDHGDTGSCYITKLTLSLLISCYTASPTLLYKLTAKTHTTFPSWSVDSFASFDPLWEGSTPLGDACWYRPVSTSSFKSS